MKTTTKQLIFAAVAAVLLVLSITITPAPAQVPTITAGANLDIDFNEEVDIPYSGFVGQWFVDINLIHNPGAGPMFKNFQSPMDDTGQRILLDAEQPFPQRVDEEFFLVPTLAPVPSAPVADWHEEIFTEGWEWVLPSDAANFPGLFDPNTSLITKNGDPHPWNFSPTPAVHEPNKLWVEFPAIDEGNVLDIHKALLWVGTPGNRIWGDDILDDGTFFAESFIRVFEYPTIPEPGTLWLVTLAIALHLVPNRHRAD